MSEQETYGEACRGCTRHVALIDKLRRAGPCIVYVQEVKGELMTIELHKIANPRGATAGDLARGKEALQKVIK
jgi:hypothetical protein